MNIDDWVIRFNSYTNKWYAAKRENYNLLFNNLTSKDVVCNKSLKNLIKQLKSN